MVAIRVDVYHHLDLGGDENLAAVLGILGQLMKGVDGMATGIERLTTLVEQTQGTAESAVVLIRGLREEVLALKSNPTPEAIDALADRLDKAVAPLADALVANPDTDPTAPAAPTPPTPPSPPTPVDDSGQPAPPDTTPSV